MRITVAFKITPDYDALRAADWARLAAAEHPGERTEAARYVRRVFNLFDEAALELALRVRDARAAQGLQTTLTAFSVAGSEADPFLSTLQALGFRAARADAGEAGGDGVLDFAPVTTARLVAAATRRLEGDVLLLGAHSSPGETGMVPFYSAEALGWPCVTEVTAIEPLADERLRVTFSTDDGPVGATADPPIVLAVGNAVVSMLRAPTLKDRLAARDERATVFSAAGLGLDIVGALAAEPARLTELASVDRHRAGVVVTGATPAEKARTLFETHLRARLESL